MQSLFKLLVSTFLLLNAAFSHAAFVSYTQNGGGVRDFGTVIALDGMTRNPIANYITYTDTMSIGGTYSFDWLVRSAVLGTATGGYLLNGTETQIDSVQDTSGYITDSRGTTTVVVAAGDVFGWYLRESPASRDRDWSHLFEVSNLTFTAATAPSAVPVPAAAWLFGSGLVGLAGLRRKKQI